MKKTLFLFLLLAGCTVSRGPGDDPIDLSGEWSFRIDSLNVGIRENWFNQEFEESIRLPGSMAENGKGDEVSVATDWTGDIVDRSYFTDPGYEKYRQPGNIKIPFWLKPVKYYKGVAWYQKSFILPEKWYGKRVVLFLERCHWESTVFVNGKAAGKRNSLSTPHTYDITSYLKADSNFISMRIDNSIIVPVGVNSHSISDHTQSNWNGVTGEISLRPTPQIFIDDIRIYPDIEKKTAKVVVEINNKGGDFNGVLTMQAEAFNSGIKQKLPVKKVKLNTNTDHHEVILTYKILKPQLWSEFDPALYRLNVALKEKSGKTIASESETFGMREFTTEGTRFSVNGRPVFLRGTTECCIFPLTGYPPTDEGTWEMVLETCKAHGLNHIRFHSFCPPEAAFSAADKLGIYFHIECGSWANQGTSVGDGGAVDKFIYEEGDRIIREYGNHPSFCMLAYGNEPAGRNQNKFLGDLITYWKSKDNRRVYTSAAGWPVIPENDYHLVSDPRIQHWGEGLKSLINASAPSSTYDFRQYVSQFKVPVVSHEIGQWCVYPDFSEISKYTGPLKPTNFEIFRESLIKNGMEEQAGEFLMASGKLQALCYKAEIEAALRTPGFSGFQLLQLHDFPGQGTALVGILNPFFESKGYITPEEFRMFCNETVPLARLPKMIYRNDEKLQADIELFHFGNRPLNNVIVSCTFTGSGGEKISEKEFQLDRVEIGNCIPVGLAEADLSGIKKAEKITLEVVLQNTTFRNKWDLWVYPSEITTSPGNVLITDRLGNEAVERLNQGGSVLLLPFGKISSAGGADVAIGFSSIFWNTAWTNNQAPHTLGILCNPGHELFTDFPTEFHSNWQWWDPVMHSQAMNLDGFPVNLKPIVQPIDTWFENRRLALVFECKTGGGKLFVCSIDLRKDLDERPVSEQLLKSVLNYMNSSAFIPQVEVEVGKVSELLLK